MVHLLLARYQRGVQVSIFADYDSISRQRWVDIDNLVRYWCVWRIRCFRKHILQLGKTDLAFVDIDWYDFMTPARDDLGYLECHLDVAAVIFTHISQVTSDPNESYTYHPV